MTLLVSLVAACSPRIFPEARLAVPATPATDVAWLASPALEGRFPGSRGDSLAAEFIRKRMGESGLQMLYDNGFQRFSLICNICISDI